MWVMAVFAVGFLLGITAGVYAVLLAQEREKRKGRPAAAKPSDGQSPG